MEASAWVYVILTIVTVGLALFIDNRQYVAGCLTGTSRRPRDRQRAVNLAAQTGVFGLLAGVSACRIAVGNDYWGYAANFRLIAQERHVSSEFGFNYIVKWMQDIFGYDHYLPVFGLFALVTVFFFVKALDDQAGWYAGALYLLLTSGYYFNSMNSVRYYLVLSIALFSMKYVIRGEYAKFVLWILAASSFHKSVLLVIPVYLAARWLAGRELKRWHYAVMAAAAGSLILFQDWYRRLIFLFYPFYEGSDFDRREWSVVNIAKCVCVLALAIFFCRDSIRKNVANRFYFFLNVAGLMVYTCGSFIPEVSRIGYYMIISQVFLIPNLLTEMKKGRLKVFFTVSMAVAFGLYFVMFLYKCYDGSIRLLPYLNWIFN